MFARLAVAVLIFGLASSGVAQPVGGDSSDQPGASESQSQPSRDQEPVRRPSIQDFLNRIARALEAANAQTEAADERSRAEDDLQAQQEMAFWAKWMFIATAASVALTGFGIWLIWLNLREARKITTEAEKTTAAAIRGADAAHATVDEAKKATEATNAAVVETRRIGEAQVRAYLSIVASRLEILNANGCPQILFKIKNFGNSPAKGVQVSFRAAYQVGSQPPRVQDDFAPKGGRELGFGNDIAVGETEAFKTMLTNFPMQDTEKTALVRDDGVQFQAIVRIEFVDVFNTVISEDEDWMGIIRAIGPPVKGFARVPFVGFRMFLSADDPDRLKEPDSG